MAVTRKTVTVMFADVADSTALGEQLDPETLRGALARWFDEARAVIERHGGTVEKYVGDSVMAVFGVPQLHEDDAARAVRAADELRRTVAEVNEQLERERGLQLTIRVGVNTGEVVTGDGAGTLVTGDAVNVAKRLEEAAGNGNVVVGDATHELVAASAEFQPLTPLAVKGKSRPIKAWRLVRIDPNALPFERRFDTPLVGRGRELEHLRRAFRRSVSERTCHLFTLLGEAGIGKTRLACELFEELADEATVLTGRCLPYGDGITFWPLHDVLRELGGEERVMELLAGNDDAELVCERLTGEPGSQELFWAVRRLCETLARDRPLVLCFEDVHWAEPTFLDLIEYLAGWIRGTPMLLICIARPEFLDERPTWLSGQDNAASLTLRPLSATESERLASGLGAKPEARARIVEVAEGNPLFVEQMSAMLVEEGELGTIPPTIQALLAARLDRLTTTERTVIECAAVAGKEFWRDSILSLCHHEEDQLRISSTLMSLVRKELIRPDRSNARPDDAFRFAHVLIRDAAYAAIPKESRAVLHERFADWLAADRSEPELEEIVGYHLEQSYRNREALGPVDDHVQALAERAAELLGRAGQRAFDRDDQYAAVKLLDRAIALLTRDDPARLDLMRLMSSALWSLGEVARAESLLNGLIEAAVVTGDRRQELYGQLQRLSHQAVVDPSVGTAEIQAVARDALPVFAEAHDEEGLAWAWRQITSSLFTQARLADATDAAEHALEHARRADLAREEARAADLLCMALVHGPTPVAEAVARVEPMLRRAAGKPLLEANLMASLAELRAMEGRFDEARRLYLEPYRTYEELGLRFALAGLTQVAGAIELLASDPAAAEKILRDGYEDLGDVHAWRVDQVALLGEALYQQARYDEARSILASTDPPGPTLALLTRARWQAPHVKLLARAGEVERAERLARDMVAQAAETDDLTAHGTALWALADVLHTAGSSAAAVAAQQAVAVFRRKGNIVAAARVDALVSQAATR